MKIYFDTEFYENGKTIELISIGAVREDGQTYYAETIDAGWLIGKDAWLRENVKIHLPHDQKKEKSIIAQELKEFVGENPEFWAYYADYDWVVLCQLFGRMIDLPKGWPMFCRDLKQLAVDIEFDTNNLPQMDPNKEHHALNDALWNQEIHNFLLTEKRKYIWRMYA